MVDSFETRMLELNLESLDEKKYVKITAFTAERVSGNIGVINWAKYATKWEYLKGFTLTWSTPNHRRFREYQSKKGVGGKPVKTVARLTTLRWTFIGDGNSTH